MGRVGRSGQLCWEGDQFCREGPVDERTQWHLSGTDRLDGVTGLKQTWVARDPSSEGSWMFRIELGNDITIGSSRTLPGKLRY